MQKDFYITKIIISDHPMIDNENCQTQPLFQWDHLGTGLHMQHMVPVNMQHMVLPCWVNEAFGARPVQNLQREGRSLPREGRGPLFQRDVGISLGFFTETPGFLRNPKTRRTPSYLQPACVQDGLVQGTCQPSQCGQGEVQWQDNKFYK